MTSWRIGFEYCSEGSDFQRSNQLSINGKTIGFTKEYLKELAQYVGLPRNIEELF